jgi:hypothetical protein
MNRRGFLVGFLAGGWIATLAVLALLHFGVDGLQAARAQDPPNAAGAPNGPPLVGPTVNPINQGITPRGTPNPGTGMVNANNRAIALSCSVGGGDSVVYYFDTVTNRLCVYEYKGGSRGGLRLLAARYIEYDLKLERYRDLSEKSPRQLPTKHVDMSGSIR